METREFELRYPEWPRIILMITIAPIGEVEESILGAIGPALAETFGQRTQLEEGVALTWASWDKRRSQHLASRLIDELSSPANPGDRVLGVVDVDIFAPGLNFIFGEAEVAGRKALISLARLRQEFYGLSGDEKLFQERAVKEAVHELGHTYGLKHCPNPACVMHFSNSLRDTDFKGRDFCPVCRVRLNQ